MALHWEEARVVVTCGEAGGLEGLPEDALVIVLKPEEVDDPEAISSIRNLVLDRTIERRRQTLSEVYELGTSLPHPLFEGEDREDEVSSAERAFLENVLAHEDACGDGDDDRVPWDDPELNAMESGLTLGGAPGSGVRIFIGRVEELVVNN